MFDSYEGNFLLILAPLDKQFHSNLQCHSTADA